MMLWKCTEPSTGKSSSRGPGKGLLSLKPTHIDGMAITDRPATIWSAIDPPTSLQRGRATDHRTLREETSSRFPYEDNTHVACCQGHRPPRDQLCRGCEPGTSTSHGAQ